MMRRNTRPVHFLLLSAALYAGSVLASPAQHKADIIKPYTASYTADVKGLPFSGSATRTLKQNTNGLWTLDFTADATFLGMKETSQFTVKNQRIIPKQYSYTRTGIGSKPTQTANFDWNKHIVNWHQKNDDWLMNLTNDAIDNLSYQLQLRVDLASSKNKQFRYHIADDDELYQREFVVEGSEVINTPVGKLNTIKVKVKRDTDKRATWIWFAKDWDYFLVKLLQKEGKTEYTIELKEASLGGKQLAGQR